MANIVLDGDMSTGHGGFPPVAVAASGNATINGKKIAVHGDVYATHNDGSTSHISPTGIGSTGVTLDGKKLLLAGDSLSCGDSTTASSNANVT